MNEVTGRLQAGDEWTIGSNLAPLRSAELPPLPPSSWKIIGPGIVAAGVGLGSSEFILFPYIASQAGLSLLWGAALVILMQWFMIMEVERYALATGETVMTGFSRLGTWWAPLMIVMTLAIGIWPGWGSAAGVLMTFLLGGSVMWWTLGLLGAIGVILTLSPTAYRSLEKAELVKVVLVGVFFVVALAMLIPAETLKRTPASLAILEFPVEQLGWPLILAALAFAGTGGGGIVCQANWIRDKGFGMGLHAPRIHSPFLTGPKAAPGTGWRFDLTHENLARWREWWRFANIEQLATFFFICVLTISLTSLLAYAMLYGRADLPSDIGFLKLQGDLLAESVGLWFAKLFWAIGAFSLFATALGVVDLTGRLIADYVRTSLRPHASENMLYAVTVWSMLAIGAAIILSGASQPVGLLIVSGALSGVMMIFVAALLIVLNRRLPAPLRPSAPRIGALLVTILFFTALAAATAADRLGLI